MCLRMAYIFYPNATSRSIIKAKPQTMPMVAIVVALILLNI